MKTRLILLSFLLTAFATCFGQELKITSFQRMDRDLLARTKERLDLNDVPCAVVRVSVSEAKAYTFDGNIIGEVGYNPGEAIVYMTQGTRVITIKSDKFGSLRYEFPEKLEKQVVYKLSMKLILEDSHQVTGRNFSLGVSGSYYMPSIGKSANGDYVGSVVDYSLGNETENAAYKSANGFSFGLFADMRLYKNLFLIAGVNFTQIKYKNTFNQTTSLSVPLTTYDYLKGDVLNSYTEDYTFNMLEVPILASYRFKINNKSHVQVNLGPVLNFGLSAKLKFSGTSDSENMKRYSISTNELLSAGVSARHTSVNTEFDLYGRSVPWIENYLMDAGEYENLTHKSEFTDSPFKRFNCGVRLGGAYEISGLSFGLYYTMMFTNMANSGYWDNSRFTVLENSKVAMSGYKQHINTFEFKVAYTLRYLKSK